MSHSIYLNLNKWMNMNKLFSFIKNPNVLIQCTGGWFEILYHDTWWALKGNFFKQPCSLLGHKTQLEMLGQPTFKPLLAILKRMTRRWHLEYCHLLICDVVRQPGKRRLVQKPRQTLTDKLSSHLSSISRPHSQHTSADTAAGCPLRTQVGHLKLPTSTPAPPLYAVW